MPRHRHARPPRVRYHFTIRYFSDLVCPTMPRSSVAPQALKLGKQRPPTLEIRGKKLARPLLLTGQHRSSPSPGHDIIQPHRREAHASRHVCTVHLARSDSVTHVHGMKCHLCDRNGPAKAGGEKGIRTLGTVSRTHAFQACSLNHSDCSPHDCLSV